MLYFTKLLQFVCLIVNILLFRQTRLHFLKEFLHIIDDHSCFKYCMCIFTKLSEIMCLINTHISMYQATIFSCKLRNSQSVTEKRTLEISPTDTIAKTRN